MTDEELIETARTAQDATSNTALRYLLKLLADRLEYFIKRG